MEKYKHTPPSDAMGVYWHHVEDWWVREKEGVWDTSMKYLILSQYNKTFFPDWPNSAYEDKPVVTKKNIRYLNRV